MEEIVVPAVFVVAGLTAVVQAVRGRRLVRRAKLWPYRKGEVTRSEVVLDHGHKNSVYEARVEYVFNVDGRDYKGDTICIGGTLHTSLRRHAEKRCARYPLGASVEVYYDPMDPSTSCLEKTGAGAELLFYLGWAFAAGGAFFLLRGL